MSKCVYLIKEYIMRFYNKIKIFRNIILMDDFVVSNLYEARNEWSVRLVSILTPLVIQGVRSIFEESWNLCIQNNEASKYLMCFQNLLSRVPKWNAIIIEQEVKRIVEKSGCHYLDDLITCVHIIVLKILTSIRVGNRQKKIDISIPKLDIFIHKVYINVARKIYTNVYLFEKNISQLQNQRYNRELEIIIQECILHAIRDSIPTEAIIRAYMDENVEHEETVTIENIEEPTPIQNEVIPEPETIINNEDKPDIIPSIQNKDNDNVVTRLTFNDVDSMMDEDNNVNNVEAPKTIERLEEIGTNRYYQRKLEEEEESDDDNERIKIHTDTIDLTGFDVLDEITGDNITDNFTLDDIEELH